MKTEFNRVNDRVLILYNKSYRYHYLRDFYKGRISQPFKTSDEAVQAYRDGKVKWKGAGDFLTVREFFDLFPFGTTFFAARAGMKYHSTLSNWATGVSSPKNPADIMRLTQAIVETAAEMLNTKLLLTTNKKPK